MVWEDNPMQESVKKLKSLGINSLVFNPCSNTPEEADFIIIMRQNLENLRVAFQ